jgi:serine/threonine protein phosphatase PrpC
MIITIGKPCAITEKGGRSNNEDSIYPLPEQVTLDQKLFMVCDGVGGAEKGEVASSLACESIQTFFSTFLKDDPTPEFIHKAVHYAEVCFDSYVQEHPEAMGMATTLTMAYIASSGIVLAHIGDSRIYHLRKGEILYQTEDHSLVNSLVKLGKITPEEANRLGVEFAKRFTKGNHAFVVYTRHSYSNRSGHYYLERYSTRRFPLSLYGRGS